MRKGRKKEERKAIHTCRPMFASMHWCHALNHHACSKIHIWSAPRSAIVVFTNACKIFCSHIYPSHRSHHKHLKPNKEARMATTEHQKRTHTPGTLQSVLSTSMRLLQIWQITSAVIETWAAHGDTINNIWSLAVILMCIKIRSLFQQQCYGLILFVIARYL